MGSSFFTSRFFVGVLLAGFGLAGCAGLSGGRVGGAWSVNGKCAAVLDWVKRFEKEFPLRTIGIYGGQSSATVANLYRVEMFEPVFGFPYEKDHEAEIRNISQNVLPLCYGETKSVKTETVQALRPLRKLVDAGFPFKEGLAQEARERTKNEAWRRQALSEIPDIPATADGFENIQNYYLSTGESETEDLWASDQKEYLRAVKARRGEIAQLLLDDLMPPPDMLPPYMASIEKIREVKPYLTALKESGDENLRALAKSYHDQARIIAAHLVQTNLKELRTIAHNQDGFRASQAWLEEFERRFMAYSDMEEVKQARQEFLGKREAIFEANRRMIYDRFASLGVGNTARQQEQVLIAETFPLPSDYQLPFYREFQANYRSKGDSRVLDLLDKSKKAVVDYYKAISGFAREMMGGNPE